jgi:hypothetical protein
MRLEDHIAQLVDKVWTVLDVIFIRLLCRHCLGETEENHEKSQLRRNSSLVHTEYKPYRYMNQLGVSHRMQSAVVVYRTVQHFQLLR